MILLFHIAVALTSMVYTTYLYFFPSRAGLQGAQLLVVLTLLTGTYLVVASSSHILQSCMTGLVYIAIVSLGLGLARHKLTVISQ